MNEATDSSPPPSVKTNSVFRNSPAEIRLSFSQIRSVPRPAHDRPVHDHPGKPHSFPLTQKREGKPRSEPARIQPSISGSPAPRPHLKNRQPLRSPAVKGGRVDKSVIKKPSVRQVQLEAQCEEARRLSRKIESIKADNALLEVRRDYLHKTIQGNEYTATKVEKLTNDLAAVQGQLSEATHHAEETNEENARMLEEIKKYSCELETLECSLKDQLAHNDKIVQAEDSLKQAVDEASQALAEKEKEIEAAQQDASDADRELGASIQQSLEEIAGLENQLDSAREEETTLKNFSQQIRTEISRLEQENAACHDKCQSETDAKNTVKHDLAAAQEKLDKLRMQNQENSEFISSVEDQIASLDLTKREISHKSSEEVRRISCSTNEQLDSLNLELATIEQKHSQKVSAQLSTQCTLKEGKKLVFKELERTNQEIHKLEQKEAERPERQVIANLEDSLVAASSNLDKLRDRQMLLLEVKKDSKETINSLEKFKQEKQSDIRTMQKALTGVQNAVPVLEADLEHAKQNYTASVSNLEHIEADLCIKKQQAEQSRCQLELSCQELENALNANLAQISRMKISQTEEQQKEQSNAARARSDLQSKLYQLQEVEKSNRDMQTKIQEIMGTIRIVGRVRGSNSCQTPLLDLDIKADKITLKAYVLNSRARMQENIYTVGFDHVFDSDASNQSICEETDYVIQSMLNGKTTSIMAYGQTGSGKTHTMSAEDGVIRYALKQIIAFSSQRPDQFRITVEAIEIYNDSIHDMLGDSNSTRPNSKPVLIRGPNGCPMLSGATKWGITSLNKAHRALEISSRSRTVASTAANDRSSRSHFIFSVHIEGLDHEKRPLHGVLHLVDLAGSERVHQSKVTGDQLRETGAINSSLSSLGTVINALQTRQSYVPYRNTKLTYFLQGALSKGATSMLITTISPEASSLEETKSTLRFADRVGKIVLK